MKFLRHGEPGQEKPGLLHGDGTIRDLSAHVPDLGGEVLTRLPDLAAIDAASLPVVPADTRLGPCVAGTGKFICIGLNYSDHAAETGAKVPPEPIIFMKATSAICERIDRARFPGVVPPADPGDIDRHRSRALRAGDGGTGDRRAGLDKGRDRHSS
jgi:2-keto-4-pentenoate hydratase/2-oxohepta-3-ene-1,7-dioic acid hydratase in catechol pathway